MTDRLRIAHLRIAPQWAILRWAILTFTIMFQIVAMIINISVGRKCTLIVGLINTDSWILDKHHLENKCYHWDLGRTYLRLLHALHTLIHVNSIPRLHSDKCRSSSPRLPSSSSSSHKLRTPLPHHSRSCRNPWTYWVSTSMISMIE